MDIHNSPVSRSIETGKKNPGKKSQCCQNLTRPYKHAYQVEDSYQIKAFSFLLFPSPFKLLPSPKETVAIWLVEFSCGIVTKSLKEAVAGPTWVQSAIATAYGFAN